MPTIQRSALVARSAQQLFALVNAVEDYPKRFAWCRQAQIIEQSDTRVLARLDLQIAGFSTWFTTENLLTPPERIQMHLHDGPFRQLQGSWQFKVLDDDACKVTLSLDFEPTSKLLAPAVALGMQGLADRMVNDFVKVAEQT